MPDSVDLASVFSLAEFEALARQCMEPAAFDYVAGGSWDELTLHENEAAFRRRRLRPRILVDVSTIDPSTDLLGQPVSMPVGLAPTAFQELAHVEGEVAVARAAGSADVLFCLSTFASRSLEEVAAASGSGPRWFQLYVPKDPAIARDLVERAATSGYTAIVLTADLPVPGYRERELRNRLRAPERFGNFASSGTGDRELLDVIGGFNEPALTWDDVAWVRGLTELPVVVKGVMTGEDATLAVQHGAAGIVVSNHGGRQLDRASASIDVLEEVVEAVAGEAEVYLDGGVRRGVDVLIALALGARTVFMGRPYVFALAAGGTAGVERALALMHSEVLTAMALLGVRRPSEVTRAHVA